MISDCSFAGGWQVQFFYLVSMYPVCVCLTFSQLYFCFPSTLIC
uniref:Uncharacterized protein n=1 Tax=Rhizophora mucronata TaxID=61149 RepID=A0A2P2MLU0_RHIMU